MRAETAEQKYDRLREQIQSRMLTAYPNPNRIDCPGSEAVEEVARRAAADIRDDTDDNPHYEHVMHCSPCYAEFLAARGRLAPPRDPSFRMPRRVEKKLGRTLDQLEAVMKDVAKNTA